VPKHGWAVVEKRSSFSTSKLFGARISLELISSNILAGLAGITSDANSLVNFARNAAQQHLFTYDEDIPVEMLVQRLCDMKQGYTQYGGEFSGFSPKPWN
jgi:20S proteasome alpha/beta subunit